MSDHELIIIIIVFGCTFLVVDAIWKVFGTQRRLDRIERHLGLDENRVSHDPHL